MNGREDPIHVVVLAPSQALRVGLRAIISDDPDIEVIGESAGPSGLEDNVANINVILAAQPGPAFLEEIYDRFGHSGPFPAVLFLSDDPSSLAPLAEQPFLAVGVLAEDAAAQEISAALKAVSEGLMVGIRSHLSVLFSRDSASPRLSGLFSEEDALVEPLTPRESEVLQLLSRGLPNKQIAYQLMISEHTVKFHISSIYSKLGAANRTEAVRAGARHGLIVL